MPPRGRPRASRSKALRPQRSNDAAIRLTGPRGECLNGASRGPVLFRSQTVNDADLQGLLTSIAAGDLDAVPILCDLLEDRGDPRAERLRAIATILYEDWRFAPFAFRHFNVTRQRVLPLFPEYLELPP